MIYHPLWLTHHPIYVIIGMIYNPKEKTMQEFELSPEEQNPKNPYSLTKTIGLAFLIVLCFLPFIFLFVECDGTSSITTPINYDNYVKIEEGMTYNRVVDILGGQQGELDTSSSYGGYTYKIYTWSNASGTRIITVSFMNNKVSAKSQIGL